MNKSFFLLIIIFVASCSGNNYSISDTLKQTIAVNNAKYLIIECYCENGIEIKKTKEAHISIEVKGKLASIGYHGEQEKPKKIGKETLSFKSELKNDTLKLTSKEWIFMHHSYLIETVKFYLPDGIEHEVVKMESGELQGRKIE